MFLSKEDKIKYLGIDDTWLSICGVLGLAMLIPIVIRPEGFPGGAMQYWGHDVVETFVIVAIFWLFFQNVLVFWRRRMPASDMIWKRATITFVLLLVAIPITQYLFRVVSTAICPSKYHNVPEVGFLLAVMYVTSFLVLALYEVIYFMHKYRDELTEREKLKTYHARTELLNLRNQVNPTFLFNGLQTLMKLIPQDESSSMSYLKKLSRFYRYISANADEQLVPLAREIEYAKLYYELLLDRYQGGLQIDLQVSDLQEEYLVPPLCVQALIANAIAHNAIQPGSPLQICLSVDEDAETLTISNNVQEKMVKSASDGMNLKDIIKRFKLFSNRPVHIVKSLHSFAVIAPIIRLATQGQGVSLDFD